MRLYHMKCLVKKLSKLNDKFQKENNSLFDNNNNNNNFDENLVECNSLKVCHKILLPNVLDKFVDNINDKKYKCDVNGCNKSYTNATNLYNHKQCHHFNRKYRCDVGDCNKKYGQNHTLLRHKRLVHAIRRPYNCDAIDCDKTFCTRNALFDHKRSEHLAVMVKKKVVNNNNNNTKDFVCDWPQCSYRCTGSRNLAAHKRQVHTVGKQPKRGQFKCVYDGCNRQYNKMLTLLVHQRLAHHINDNFTDSRVNTNQNKQITDKEIVNNNKDFVCNWPQCTYRYTGPPGDGSQELVRHKKIRHKLKPKTKAFRCVYDGCDKQYYNVAELLKHRRSAHNIYSNRTANKYNTITGSDGNNQQLYCYVVVSNKSYKYTLGSKS
ncbi:zinc finger protein 429-like [Oppia nitens]|uniref:zinc finger protein 429-like n=1 Tax=Oppia nitens TaxID=1686743 RepID=UPI0023DB00E5|nr:zinc finger protein 429-like [Oppia nitens]